MSPDNIIQCYVSLPNDYTLEFIERLTQVMFIESLNFIDETPSREFKSDHIFFRTRHIPPTHPNCDHNIINVEGCSFVHLRSM